jgi:ATP-binding cassette subfamily B protein
MKRKDKDTENRPKSRNLRPLRRLAGFLRPYRVTLVAAMAVLAVAAGTVLAFGQVIRQVVDHGLASGSQAELNQALLLFLAVVVLMAISVAGRVYLVTWVGERVVADVRKAVFGRVLSLDPTFFEVTRTGEVISRLTTDTSILQAVVGSTLAIAVRNTLLIIGGIVMLAFTSPKLTVLVLFGVPLVIAPLWLLGYRVRRLSRDAQDRIADLGAYIDETLHGIQTVQAFCHEAIDRKRYADRVESAFATALRRSRLSALLTGIVILLMFGAIGVVLWTGGRDVLAGRLSGGELSAFVFYAVLVAGSVGALSEVAGDLLRAAGAAERLMEILSTEPEIREPQNPAALPDPSLGRLEVEDVTFYYPSRPDTPALDGFSLKITSGEKIALVGPSGAGKSTLFQLLLRFYDPQQGSICFDDQDLRTVSPSELRRRIALVPQDPVIFGADAWENIRFGFEDIGDSEVLQAAQAAHAKAFLEELPEGFSSFLGERGVRLSGGQRQRIAIARAILRDPALLLLDEATSALDAESERLVQDALERLMQRRTTIIIAHRLATVRSVDRIVVMEQGRVIASGKHEELIKQGGLYARLAALQFREGGNDVESLRIRETA